MGMVQEEKITPNDLVYIATDMDNWSFGEIKGMLTNCYFLALKRVDEEDEDSKIVVTKEDLQKAVIESRPKRYTIKKFVAAGGCGAVVLCADQDGNSYAMKTEVFDRDFKDALLRFESSFKKENKRSIRDYKVGDNEEENGNSNKQDSNEAKLKEELRVQGCGQINPEEFKEESKGNRPKPLSTPRLPLESAILRTLTSNPKTAEHSPIWVDDGIYQDFNFVVMELAGPSLDSLRRSRGKNGALKLSSCLKVAWQSLESLKAVHRIGYVHRDVKPHNLTIGAGQFVSTLYLLDFGIARNYIGKPFPEEPSERKKKFIGTIRYASRKCHDLKDQTPVDDIEAWVYTFFECIDPDCITWRRLERLSQVKAAKHQFFLTDSPRCNSKRKIPRPLDKLLDLVNSSYLSQEVKFDYYATFKLLRGIIDELKIDLKQPFEWEKSLRGSK
uniref:Protein kinase domain-containing protein n=1 Tax=Rhabditophanes sp. KR3021 TaxID=114890 RepID=A0AC35UHT3_9BILA